MKLLTSALAVTAMVASVSVMAAPNISIEVGSTKELRQCKRKLSRVSERRDALKAQLVTCQMNSGNYGDLIRDNQDLRDEVASLDREVDFLSSENAKLERRVERLQRKLDEATRPAPKPVFNLAASIKACGQISNSYYASSCKQTVKQYKVKAKVVSACTGIKSSVYAAECVTSAGKYNGTAAQAKSCSKITNGFYASACMEFAAKGKVSGAVVKSCVESETSSIYQAGCVSDMAN